MNGTEALTMDDGQVTLQGKARFEHYVVPEVDVMLRSPR